MAAPDLELGLGSILLDLHGTGILEMQDRERF